MENNTTSGHILIADHTDLGIDFWNNHIKRRRIELPTPIIIEDAKPNLQEIASLFPNIPRLKPILNNGHTTS